MATKKILEFYSPAPDSGTMIPTLLLAAGKSSRMRGGDKLMEMVDGQPLLTTLAERALSVGPVLITLPPNHVREAAVPKAAQVITVDGEMSDSIHAGLAALPHDAPGVIVLPADMPDIIAEDLLAVQAAVTPGAMIVRATTQDGKPGHPTYFDRATFPAFKSLKGDRGAFLICASYEDQTTYVPLTGQRARLDLDTPEDWAAYRKGLL